MTEEELREIEARAKSLLPSAFLARAGMTPVLRDDVPALIAEVRFLAQRNARLSTANAALRELDESRAELGHENARLREYQSAIIGALNPLRPGDPADAWGCDLADPNVAVRQIDGLRESLAAMTNERNQWREEATLNLRLRQKQEAEAWDQAEDEQP